MHASPVLTGRFNDHGQLCFSPEERVQYDARGKELAGKRVTLKVDVLRNTRSLRQNAWIWGVAYPLIAETIGYDRHEHDEMHYALVAKCFGTHTDEKLGAEVPNVRSSKLDTKEFGEYMEWLVRFAAQQWSCVIPLPDEELTSRSVPDPAH